MNNFRIITLLFIFIISKGIFAQSKEPVYEDVKNAPAMHWVCPEIEKYQNVISSAKDNDYKIYANNIKKQIELYSNPTTPENK